MRSVLLFAAGLSISALLAATQSPDLSTRSLVAAAAQYVAAYQSEFKFLVADETYTQRVLDGNGRERERRQMEGELFLAFIPADDAWIAVHDVATVDGRPVPNRDDLRALLKQGEVTRVALLIADRNASFNIGNISRNFNEPTLALLLLGPRRVKGVSFDRRDVVRHAEGTRATLSFIERDRPTLIRSMKASVLYARGEIALDASTGRIEKTTFELRDGGTRVRLITDYALEERLAMWVPSVFTERYERDSRSGRELIVCEAKYSNYRRFEVTGRIK